MNLIDSSSVPGEDAIAYPDSWTPHLLDRRGRGEPRSVTIDPDAPQRLVDLYAEKQKAFEGPLTAVAGDPLGDLLRAGIAQEADPLAAAFAAAAMVRHHYQQRASIHDTALHAWIARHGLGFAAAAMLELYANGLTWFRSSQHPANSVVRYEPAPIHDVVRYAVASRQALADLRSLLAAMPDAEYEAARDALGARRTSDAHRFVSAALMPDQEDWVRDACVAYAGRRYTPYGANLVWTFLSDPEHLELAGVRFLDDPQYDPAAVARAVDALGVDALALLTDSLEQTSTADFRGHLYDAIGRLPSEAGIAYLLERTIRPQALTALREAAARFPVRTLRAVASIAPGASLHARARISGLVREFGLDSHLSDLDDKRRAQVEELLSATARRQVADALPDVFATPPWTPFRTSAKTAVDGLTAPAIDELRWAEGEREEWGTLSKDSYLHYYLRRDPSMWDKAMPNGPDPEHYWFMELLAWADDERAQAALPLWAGAVTTWTSLGTLRGILARYGPEVAPKVLEIARKRPSFRAVMLPFVNQDAARIAADLVSRPRGDRALGRAWLDRHAAAAAALLVPDALGKVAKQRQSAADALKYLAASNRAVLDEQAAAYGPAAAEAVAAIVDADPLDPQRRVPKPPAWADPAMLPAVLLRGREAALPDAAVRTLMSALALDDPERLYPGADLLAAECDPASLTSFSWGLFELWLSAGSPSKDGWAMDQLRRFADDQTVRRLTALIREWPGQSQSRKAVRGLEVLGHIGTETALRAVQAIAGNAKFKALKKTAAAQIEVIAERLELSTDQLADRLVPDFGLSSDEPLVLDYGPRRFTVKFDENLKPFVVDGLGKRRAGAPKPAAADDAELAQPAYERFTSLRKELKAAAVDQVKRLETAMVDARTWTVPEFRRYLVEHPVSWQLTGRLVWQCSTGDGWRSFRLAEDRTPADSEDEPFEIPEDAEVRIAHPVGLGDEVAAWGEIFADYEILQPFEQLTRRVFALTDEDRATGRVVRFEGGKTGAGPMVGLLKRGWKYGSARPGPHGYGIFREFPEGGYLLLESDPGVHPGYGYDEGEQTLTRVEIGLPETGEIDPVRLSEALLTVSRLTRSA
ncbi:DUF4132 domain-containing protein [Glycomyces albidus]|uniref:DUF4132 domain-containing protein n=1 Tax=Glycomyces albidus TaxID=2656774 RepID=A0A6L5GDA8_9ACTN|nr:DUF4132 domain-containing protein [Glycomyces albidus]MQM27546.1 DUF4132 domain-containing protein [Glycomyces albidus]